MRLPQQNYFLLVNPYSWGIRIFLNSWTPINDFEKKKPIFCSDHLQAPANPNCALSIISVFYTLRVPSSTYTFFYCALFTPHSLPDFRFIYFSQLLFFFFFIFFLNFSYSAFVWVLYTGMDQPCPEFLKQTNKYFKIKCLSLLKVVNLVQRLLMFLYCTLHVSQAHFPNASSHLPEAYQMSVSAL